MSTSFYSPICCKQIFSCTLDQSVVCILRRRRGLCLAPLFSTPFTLFRVETRCRKSFQPSFMRSSTLSSSIFWFSQSTHPTREDSARCIKITTGPIEFGLIILSDLPENTLTVINYSQSLVSINIIFEGSWWYLPIEIS